MMLVKTSTNYEQRRRKSKIQTTESISHNGPYSLNELGQKLRVAATKQEMQGNCATVDTTQAVAKIRHCRSQCHTSIRMYMLTPPCIHINMRNVMEMWQDTRRSGQLHMYVHAKVKHGHLNVN